MDARDDVLPCFVFPGAAMSSTRLDDPILTRFRQALGEVYGSKLERVALFGSRARGDAPPDYDVAVFIHQPEGFGEESGRLAAIETDILFDTGAVINALLFHAGAYRKRTGLMSELRRDGIDL
jgi:predicted nucleotidyltransferase